MSQFSKRHEPHHPDPSSALLWRAITRYSKSTGHYPKLDSLPAGRAPLGKFQGGNHERIICHFRVFPMVSLAQPDAVESTDRLEPRVDIRRFRSIRTYSHHWRCAAPTPCPIRIQVHSV